MIHSIMYVRVALPSQSSKSINTVVYFLSYKIIVYVSIVGKKKTYWLRAIVILACYQLLFQISIRPASLDL